MSGRKETVLDLAKFVDKGVQVKLTGGRLVTGTLKGYDQLLNLVLDEAVEFLRARGTGRQGRVRLRPNMGEPSEIRGAQWGRDQGGGARLGRWDVWVDEGGVCRGTAVMLVSPTDGTDEISNPFVQPDGA
ncbi:hypothetical protein SASPL_137439 [Salvia splendens]|uniref:Sm domain-containing protein n=1 Tax=Salvia splendens TaxID=180675 RepID=A0A8X8WSW2_SALSN|nr:hypothetical protein SASPL_137439 [Salvia splendens]